MASDACLPEFFTKKNKQGSYPRIIIIFFILCSLILIITKGNLLSLAGVYTIAFLGVMSSFALGNLILKEVRSELKRTYKAPTIIVILAFLATLFGMIGNIRIDINNLKFFEIYFIPSAIIVLYLVYQDYVLIWLLRQTKPWNFIHKYILAKFEDIVDGRFIVFVHHPVRLYEILTYIHKNETGRNILLVHCKNGADEQYNLEIKELLPALKKAGVLSHLNIKLVSRNESFSPETVDKVSKEYKVSKNRIFMGSIHDHHLFDYEDFGGVRIIF
jgi:hypothetical protein